MMGLRAAILVGMLGLSTVGQGRTPPQVLIVTGLGGEPKFTAEFVAQAQTIRSGLERLRGDTVWLRYAVSRN